MDNKLQLTQEDIDNVLNPKVDTTLKLDINKILDDMNKLTIRSKALRPEYDKKILEYENQGKKDLPLSDYTEIINESYIQKLKEEFTRFNFEYPFLFSKIVKGLTQEDKAQIATFLSEIKRIQNKKTTLEEVEKKLGENLKKKYIVPAISKK